MILLLPADFHQQRVAHVIVMQVKGNLVVPVTIGLDCLPVGDPGVLHQDVNPGSPLPIGATYEPFNGEAVIGCVTRE